jgi:predicted ABC-type ATPase
MFIVAGPPGGGKSSLFALSDFADHFFNADDRAAQLNAGSYERIPISVRTIVNREFEAFIFANIRSGASFALETTLRGTMTFDQAKLAREYGFRVSMWYVALETVERHIERVKRRAAQGGHSASEATLRKIYASSLANLPLALNPEKSAIEFVRIYDNSRFERRPNLVLEARRGRMVRLAPDFPEWLLRALGWTADELKRHRAGLAQQRGLDR